MHLGLVKGRTILNHLEGSHLGNRYNLEREEVLWQPKIEISQEAGLTPKGPVSSVLHRSTRVTKPPDHYVPELISVCQAVGPEPRDYSQVIKLPKADRICWEEAMKTEMESMRKHAVFSAATVPQGKKAIGTRWVFKLKHSQTGGAPVYIARLVAKGFNQTAQDYDEIFSPTVRAETFRTILVYAARRGWQTRHVDVEMAFLHTPLEEGITLYMQEPEVFQSPQEGQVLCLHKAIYGLRQSPHQWNVCLDSRLRDIGFTASKADPCLNMKDSGENQILFLWMISLFWPRHNKELRMYW